MKEQLRSASPYISVFGLILLLASLVVRGVATVDQNVVYGMAILGAILVFAWPVLAWSDFQAALGSRRARFGGNAILLAFAVVAGLMAIYFIGTRYYYTADLTTNKQFTLQRQTIQVLDSLRTAGKQVALTAIMRSQLDPSYTPEAEADFKRLIEGYTKDNPNVTVTVIRPDTDPVAVNALAQRLGVANAGTLLGGLVAESGAKHATVTDLTQKGVTEAIIKATREQDTTVYFTTGHGEPADTDPTAGYSVFRRELEQKGYTVQTLNLATMTQTLKAGEVVVVAGPTRAFQPSEAATLARFVHGQDTRGAVLMLLGTPFDYPPGTPPDLGLGPVYRPWDIQPQNDVVYDAIGGQYTGNPLAALVFETGWLSHPITEDLTQLMAIFPDSRSIVLGAPMTATLTAAPLVQTGPQSLGVTDFESLRAQQEPTEGGAKPGPLVLGVAAEGGEEAGRLVFYSSALMASDYVLASNLSATFANNSLALNSVNWLSRQEDLITVEPTDPDNRTLKSPQSPALLWWFLAVIFPLAIVGIGVYAWWRRR